MNLNHQIENEIPACIADAPAEIINGARTIAAASLSTIREMIDEQVGGCEEAKRDFVTAICYFMVWQSINNN